MSGHKPSRSPVRWFIYAGVFLLIALAVWHFGFRAQHKGKQMANPAWAGDKWPQKVPVRTVAARAQDLPVHLKAIATATPLNTVTVRSRVEGELLKLAFEEGQQVKQGDLLAEIDPASFKIRVAQAEGELRQVVARLNNARADLERIRELHTRNLVANQELDVQTALVAEREGAAAASQALLDDARLQLSYTRIEAPISGRTGLRRVDVGNLVREGDTDGIVVITQTKPIAVTFTIPELELQGVLDPFRAGESLTVEAWDRSERNLLATGTLKTIDNQIDLSTGTLKLKAEFANEDNRLFPNQFVNARLRVRTIKDSVIIPAAAVQFGARGTYVYVIDENKKAVVRSLVLGPVEGTDQAVTSGLKVGEEVVLEGLDRLREGSEVVLANDPPKTPITAPKAPGSSHAK